MLLKPSYGQGFARNAAQSAFSELWRGLVGLWSPSLGPTGLTLHDWSGHKNDGILTSMDAATDWTVTERGYANDYDGAAHFIDLGDILPFNETLFSVVVWMRLSVLGVRNTILSKEGDSGSSPAIPIMINSNAAGNLLELGIGNGTSFQFLIGTTALVADRWYHVAITRDDIDGRIYLDGRQESTTGSLVSGTIANSHPVYIGARNHNTFPAWFNGHIGDASLYDRVLTQNEITKIYAGASPLVLKRPSIPNAQFGYTDYYRGLLLQGDRL